MTTIALVLYSLKLLPVSEAAYDPDSQILYRYELAEACQAATDEPFEQQLCIKIARFESAFRLDVGRCEVQGKAGELSAWQILPRGQAERDRLCVSYAEDARLALERVHESRQACRRLPLPEQLALYTRGSCSSETGRRLSRHRWVYPRELMLE